MMDSVELAGFVLSLAMVYCNIKEFHDHLNKKCGLVLIGTNQLKEKIERLKKKDSPGMPLF